MRVLAQTVTRTTAAWLLLALACLVGTRTANAAATPVHSAHSRRVSKQTAEPPQEKSTDPKAKSAPKPPAKSSKSAQSTEKSAAKKAPAPKAKAHSRRQPEEVDPPDPPVIHRATVEPLGTIQHARVNVYRDRPMQTATSPESLAEVEREKPVDAQVSERIVPADEIARQLRTDTHTSVKVRPEPDLAEVAEEPVATLKPKPAVRNASLRMPAPLKGSREVLVHQNEVADDEGLDRIEDAEDLHRLRAKHQLVDIPQSAALHVNPELGRDRRCARPWTVKFLTDTGAAYYKRFHQSLNVNSAARTADYQRHLQRVNGNAAATAGEAASPHLTGQAVDLGKRGMSAAEIAWMRSYLKPLMDAGKIDVEEEFQQACFHISVYKMYLPPVKRVSKHTEIAQAHTPHAPARRATED